MKRLAVGVLVASALTAAAPAIAQAPTLTLAISRVAGGPQGTTTFVRFGELVRVSGAISTGAANRPVDLLISPYGGTMQTIRLTTDSSGSSVAIPAGTCAESATSSSSISRRQ